MSGDAHSSAALNLLTSHLFLHWSLPDKHFLSAIPFQTVFNSYPKMEQQKQREMLQLFKWPEEYQWYCCISQKKKKKIVTAGISGEFFKEPHILWWSCKIIFSQLLKALSVYAYAKTSMFLQKNVKTFYWKRNKRMCYSLNQHTTKKFLQE